MPEQPTACCDFSRSFFHFEIDLNAQPTITVTRKQPLTLNHVRIPLECRCFIEGDQGEQYILGASCKTELVNVKRDMWSLPNADFCVVSSMDDFLLIKQFHRRELKIERESAGAAVHQERQFGRTRNAWSDHRIDVHECTARLLTQTSEIIDAVIANRALVSRTSLTLADGRKAVIEYPVKTINVSPRDGFYQVDTGPVLVPAVIAVPDPFVAGFRLAYIAHNAPDWAEFVVNMPTDAGEGVWVDHFSEPLGVKATNQMFLLDD